MGEVTNRASDLVYLRFFYQEADFGPAHSDVVAFINEAFKDQTGKNIPEGYDYGDNL